MSIVEDKINLIDDADKQLIASLERLDQKLLTEIILIYAGFKVGKDVLGFDPLKAAQIEQMIIKAIQGIGYKQVVNTYIKNFDVLSELNKALHKEVNNLDVTAVVEENARIKAFLSDLEAQLRGTPTRVVGGQAIRNTSLDELIQPIANVIRKDIILGTNYTAATNAIKEAIEKQDLGLSRWGGQIATDSLNQFDGLQQQQIKDHYDLKYITYVGNVRATTRPFCLHMMRKGQFTEDELKKALDEFCPNGLPSQTETRDTANGKKQKKGNGLIAGTDVSNFLVRRGGYNCGHQAIATNIKQSDKNLEKRNKRINQATEEYQKDLKKDEQIVLTE